MSILDFIVPKDYPEVISAAIGAFGGTALSGIASERLREQLLSSYDIERPQLPKWIERVSESPDYSERLSTLAFTTGERFPDIPREEVQKYLKKKDVQISEHVPPDVMGPIIRLGEEFRGPVTIPRKTFLDLVYLLEQGKYRSLTSGEGIEGFYYSMIGPYYNPYLDTVTVSYLEDPGVIAHEFGHSIQGRRWKGMYLPILHTIGTIAALSSLPGALLIAANTGNIGHALAFAILAGMLATMINTGIEVEASLLGRKLIRKLQIPHKVDPSGGWFARLSPMYPMAGWILGLLFSRLIRGLPITGGEEEL